MGHFYDYQIAIVPWGAKARFAKAKVGLAREGSIVYIAVFGYLNKDHKFEISPKTIQLLPAAIRLITIEKDLFIRTPSDEQRYHTMIRQIKVILNREKHTQGDKADTFKEFIAQIPTFDSLNLKDLVPAPLAVRFVGDRDRCYNCGQTHSCGKYFGCDRCQETRDDCFNNGGGGGGDGDHIVNAQHKRVLADSNLTKRLKNKKLYSIKLQRLDKVPKELWLRNSLSELSLIDCNLTKIPKELMKFSSTLIYLDLSNNKITELPRVFCCKMNNLFSLNLKQNQIETLPIEIKFFSRLVDLDISENRLRMLPTTFSDLRRLRNLNVAHNNLSQLPAFRSEQIRLKRLDVSDNPLDGALTGFNTFEVYPSYDGPLSYNENVFCPKTSPMSKKKHFPSLFEISMLNIVRCDKLLKLASEESLPNSIVSTMQRDIFKCYKCSKMNILPAYNSTDMLDYVDHVETLLSTNFRHGMTFMKLLCRNCFDNMR